MTNLHFIVCIIGFLGLFTLLISFKKAGWGVAVIIYIGILVYARFMLPVEWEFYVSRDKLFIGTQGWVAIIVAASFISHWTKWLLRLMVTIILFYFVYQMVTTDPVLQEKWENYRNEKKVEAAQQSLQKKLVKARQSKNLGTLVNTRQLTIVSGDWRTVRIPKGQRIKWDCGTDRYYVRANGQGKGVPVTDPSKDTDFSGKILYIEIASAEKHEGSCIIEYYR